MAAMVMTRNCRYLNLTSSFNTATLGLRRNFMEMTTKSTLPMEPMEQMHMVLPTKFGQVMAMISLTLETTGMDLEHMEAEETILSTFQ